MTQGMNTVFGRPEQLFRMEWVSLLWRAMRVTGKGYRHYTLKNRPPAGASHWRGERRKDKVEGARRLVANPIFTGKINFRRSDRVAA